MLALPRLLSTHLVSPSPLSKCSQALGQFGHREPLPPARSLGLRHVFDSDLISIDRDPVSRPIRFELRRNNRAYTYQRVTPVTNSRTLACSLFGSERYCGYSSVSIRDHTWVHHLAGCGASNSDTGMVQYYTGTGTQSA